MKEDTFARRLQELNAALVRMGGEVEKQATLLKQKRSEVLLSEIELCKKKMLMAEAQEELAQLSDALAGAGLGADEAEGRLKAFEGRYEKVVAPDLAPRSADCQAGQISGHSEGSNDSMDGSDNDESAGNSTSSSESGDCDNHHPASPPHQAPATQSRAFPDGCGAPGEAAPEQRAHKAIAVLQPEPLSRVLVGKDAVRSASVGELRAMLNDMIEQAKQRAAESAEAMKEATCAPKQPSISELKAMLGSMIEQAKQKEALSSEAKKEAAGAHRACEQPSVSELRGMLSEMIEQAAQAKPEAPQPAELPAQQHSTTQEPATAPAAKPAPKQTRGDILEQMGEKNAPPAPQTLIEAAKSGDAKQVAAMLEHSANIFEVDEDQCTALHWAAAMGNTAIMEELIKVGGDTLLMFRNSGGKSCLFYAARAGHEDCVRLLVKKGNEEFLSMAAYDGSTAVDVAKKAGKGVAVEIERALLKAQKRRERVMNMCDGEAKKGAALTRSKSSNSLLVLGATGSKLAPLKEAGEDICSRAKSASPRKLLPPPTLD